jgi:hypothetical protein
MFERRIQVIVCISAVLGCTAPTSSSTSPDIVIVKATTTPVHTPPVNVEAEAEPAPEPKPLSPTSAAAKPLHAGRVLISAAAEPSWATGSVLLREANGYHERWRVERLADIDVLPPDLQRYSGMEVDLFAPEGRVCTVVLDSLTLEAHVAMEDVGGHEAQPGAEALWKALSGDTSHAVLLVASFPKDPRCEGALWARDASLPEPVVLVPGDADEHGKLLAAEHRRVLESDAGKVLATEWQKYITDPEYADEDAVPWSTVSEGQRDVWMDENGDARVVSINFGSHRFTPCHWLGPAHGVVRSLAGEGEDLFVTAAHYSPPPVAVFDADLDGRWELLWIHDNGDFNRVSLHSETRVLLMSGFDLPDHSWVWC